MRWLIFTLVLTSVGLTAETPTEVALRVLEGIQKPGSTLPAPEDLAVSPFCGQSKRRVIDQQWNRRARWLQTGKVQLSPGIEKIDGELAGVLIEVRPDDGPDSVTMISLAMKQEQGSWKVAPVEGSFDNVGLGFGKKIQNRVRELERWMALKKLEIVAALQEEANREFQTTLSEAVELSVLEGAEPEQALQHFLDAAERGDANQVLVWMGLLERGEFPDREWENEIRITRLGMKGIDARRTWRLLTSGNVMKVAMNGDGDEEDHTYLVSFLSNFEVEPNNETRTPVRFYLDKSTKGWRVKLPAIFSHANENQRGHRAAQREEMNWDDIELSKEMGRVFEARHPALRAESAQDLLKLVVEDLGKGNLTDYLRRLYREVEGPEQVEEPKAEDEELEKLEALDPEFGQRRGWRNRNGQEKVKDIDERRLGRYQEAVHWWGGILDDLNGIEAKPQKIFEEEGLAVGVILIESTQGSWEPVFQNVWMAQDGDGWYVVPGVDQPMTNSMSPTLADTREKLARKVKSELGLLAKVYLEDLLKKVALLEPAGVPLPEEEARKVILDWRRLLVSGTMMQLLDRSAIRKVPENPALLLRDLGYVRSGAAAATVEDKILGSRALGRFRAFSLMVDEGRGLEMSCPMIVVVPTTGGPRVLVDAEIFLESNKAKRMRNADVLENLEKEMTKEDFAAFQELVDWHEKTSRPFWEEWNQNKVGQSQ